MMKSKMWSGVFFICGTSIGTGMLAIPSVTAESGLIYSAVSLFLCWFFSTWAALYLMEAHLWQADSSTNLLTMAERCLGLRAKFFVWVIYLALLYSLMCTYLLAGSSWIHTVLHYAFDLSLSRLSGMLLFIGCVGLFIFFGIRVVDRVNRVMSLGLVLSLALILALTLPCVSSSVLFDKLARFSSMPPALPLLITAFGYSIIVPSLNHYFNKDPLLLRQSIMAGSLIILAVYFLWEVATLGNIPWLGEHGLQQVALRADDGTAVAKALSFFVQKPLLAKALTVFAIFAVITSFLGVSMALYHALVDGFGLKKRGGRGLWVLMLTYVPPMIFLLTIPTGFCQILSWAGVLVALLMGILPVVMVWKGRYVEQRTQGYRVIGGKPLLVTVGLFYVLVILAEFFT